MPTTCGFPNCRFRSRYRGAEDNRHFYRVPKKPAILRKRWLEAIGRTEETIVSQLRVCSGHFHGGEKHEGDIPVADPAVDKVVRIELPPKASRLKTNGNGHDRGGYGGVRIGRVRANPHLARSKISLLKPSLFNYFHKGGIFQTSPQDRQKHFNPSSSSLDISSSGDNVPLESHRPSNLSSWANHLQRLPGKKLGTDCGTTHTTQINHRRPNPPFSRPYPLDGEHHASRSQPKYSNSDGSSYPATLHNPEWSCIKSECTPILPPPKSNSATDTALPHLPLPSEYPFTALFSMSANNSLSHPTKALLPHFPYDEKLTTNFGNLGMPPYHPTDVVSKTDSALRSQGCVGYPSTGFAGTQPVDYSLYLFNRFTNIIAKNMETNGYGQMFANMFSDNGRADQTKSSSGKVLEDSVTTEHLRMMRGRERLASQSWLPQRTELIDKNRNKNKPPVENHQAYNSGVLNLSRKPCSQNKKPCFDTGIAVNEQTQGDPKTTQTRMTRIQPNAVWKSCGDQSSSWIGAETDDSKTRLQEDVQCTVIARTGMKRRNALGADLGIQVNIIPSLLNPDIAANYVIGIILGMETQLLSTFPRCSSQLPERPVSAPALTGAIAKRTNQDLPQLSTVSHCQNSVRSCSTNGPVDTVNTNGTEVNQPVCRSLQGLKIGILEPNITTIAIARRLQPFGCTILVAGHEIRDGFDYAYNVTRLDSSAELVSVADWLVFLREPSFETAVDNRCSGFVQNVGPFKTNEKYFTFDEYLLASVKPNCRLLCIQANDHPLLELSSVVEALQTNRLGNAVFSENVFSTVDAAKFHHSKLTVLSNCPRCLQMQPPEIRRFVRDLMCRQIITRSVGPVNKALPTHHDSRRTSGLRQSHVEERLDSANCDDYSKQLTREDRSDDSESVRCHFLKKNEIVPLHHDVGVTGKEVRNWNGEKRANMSANELRFCVNALMNADDERSKAVQPKILTEAERTKKYKADKENSGTTDGCVIVGQQNSPSSPATELLDVV
ncbi:unnamed protein product [Calicophoron daubneyi]|uniref:THAP-type domain-containing protein n=1 Tax=Calicophoron daubneyi TaxID=300641 RepID=A0AAV2TM04_CALDB